MLNNSSDGLMEIAWAFSVNPNCRDSNIEHIQATTIKRTVGGPRASWDEVPMKILAISSTNNSI